MAKSFIPESDWDALESQFVTGADGQYDALEGGIFDGGDFDLAEANPGERGTWNPEDGLGNELDSDFINPVSVDDGFDAAFEGLDEFGSFDEYFNPSYDVEGGEGYGNPIWDSNWLSEGTTDYWGADSGMGMDWDI